MQNHQEPLLLVEQDEEMLFEEIFKTHFNHLHAYAYTILKDEDVAEELVQALFLKLWEKKSFINVKISLKSYLYRSVYNESINLIKHRQVKQRHQDHLFHAQDRSHEQTSHRLLESELSQQFQEALNNLPEKCRTIFQMSRFEELKYQEIADRLQISIKTVESQMGKALKSLRLALADFLPLLIYGLLYFILR